jgi:hypothetical protein
MPAATSGSHDPTAGITSARMHEMNAPAPGAFVFLEMKPFPPCGQGARNEH